MGARDKPEDDGLFGVPDSIRTPNALDWADAVIEEVQMILDSEEDSRGLSGPEAADHFRRLQKELSGDRVFKDGAELLREVREEDPVPEQGGDAPGSRT